MIKNTFCLMLTAALLSLGGCSPNAGPETDCYVDKLPDEDKAITRMLTEPHFKGGNDSLVNFLTANIDLQKLRIDFSENGSVYNDTARIKFIVSKEGNLSDLTVTRAKNKSFADELTRVIKISSCNWVAGRAEQVASGWFDFDIYFGATRSNNEVKTTMTFNDYGPSN